MSCRKSAFVKGALFVVASDDEVAKSNKLLQNVKYDSSTGKMYEELGASATSNGTNALAPSGHPEIVTSVNSASAAAAAAAATAAALAGNDYYQSYQAYPYGSSNYMSSFNYGNVTTGTTATYDRSSVAVPTSMYNPYNSPATAFVPHSAINLSVKPGTEASAAGTQSSLDLSETAAAGSASISAPYLASQQDFSSQPIDNSTVEVSRSAVSTGHSIQTNSSPQILDLTRPGSLVPGTNPASFSVPTIPTVPASIGQSLTKSTTSDGSSSNSKREQTEPMDFSSGQAMTFPNRSFDTTSFNRGTSPGDLSRFRSSAASNEL